MPRNELKRRLGNPDMELVSSAAQQRNWRGIAIALLVILIVCSLIITAVILATPKVEDPYYGEKFSLNDFFNKSLKPKAFITSWLKNDRFLYRDDDGVLYIFNCSTNSSLLLLDNTTFRSLNTDIYWLSADEEFLLLKHDIDMVFRHTTLAFYTVVKLDTKEEFVVRGYEENKKLQYVGWSSADNAMVIVQDNNIYYRNSYNGNLEPITDSGRPNEIYNGIPDWVYEEDILGVDHALWWSPEGGHLCYAVFNDSLVSLYTFPLYGEPDNIYTKQESIHYPKPGSPNPTFQLKVIRLADRKEVILQPPVLFGREYYFTVVQWIDEHTLLVVWMNRLQNLSHVTICYASNGSCSLSIEEEGHGGWVSLYRPAVFAPDGLAYFWVLPQRDTVVTGYYNNVAMIQITAGTNAKHRKSFLTFTPWEATSVEAYDADRQIVYFIGTGGDPRRRHLYSVTVNKVQTCLTCELDEKHCEYVEASFSPSANYYLLHCLGPGVPYHSLYSTHQTHEIRRLENNTWLGEQMATKALPRVKYIQIESDSKEKMWGKLLLPPELNEQEIVQYPLLVSVYGGPGTQKVTEQFDIGWETYLCSSRNIVIMYVDGRGTGGRGQKWMHQIYHRLGTLEVDDSIKATREMFNYDYIDTNKVAIWGSSYGGFVTASALGRAAKDFFSCGISVAPVTDWIYYNSVYTERYMGLPNENLQGYKEANVSRYIEHFKGRLLLIHGTADDNVHFQHSAQLMKSMIEANIYFRTMVYPDKSHTLTGGNTQHHLYEMMEDFLVESFEGFSQKFGHVPDMIEDD